uniref:Uncharacterized protein n=1 Tax=Rhizophora mucronata TaxID=61149 RepID=A0A2P2PM98_RHIMU
MKASIESWYFLLPVYGNFPTLTVAFQVNVEQLKVVVCFPQSVNWTA